MGMPSKANYDVRIEPGRQLQPGETVLLWRHASGHQEARVHVGVHATSSRAPTRRERQFGVYASCTCDSRVHLIHVPVCLQKSMTIALSGLVLCKYTGRMKSNLDVRWHEEQERYDGNTAI